MSVQDGPVRTYSLLFFYFNCQDGPGRGRTGHDPYRTLTYKTDLDELTLPLCVGVRDMTRTGLWLI